MSSTNGSREKPHPLKKHPCPDCSFCQWCGDDRCALCLRKTGSCRKLSVSEQIAFYESVNRSETGDEHDETSDLLRGHDLRVIQPKNGYRFSLDPVILCDFAAPARGGDILDLGCGCGIIPLLMARLAPESRVTGVELQTSMAELAVRNAELNGLSGRISIIESDILDLGDKLDANGFDLVLANPPYRRAGSGRISPKPGRDLSRHESTASLADFLVVAKRLVKNGGRICFIHLPERLPELMGVARELKLAPRRLRMVHGGADAPARMFMIELLKGSRGAMEVLPPLLVYSVGGEYSAEMKRIYRDSGPACSFR